MQTGCCLSMSRATKDLLCFVEGVFLRVIFELWKVLKYMEIKFSNLSVVR